MSTKTKNIKSNTEKLGALTQQAGMLLMTAAFTLSMIEVGGGHSHQQKVAMPSQPSPAYAHAGTGHFGSFGGGHDMRREREETGPHYTSYNTAQRTPGRTGKA